MPSVSTFSGKNLQGHNFRGKELSGQDFSFADIRGADFTDATLDGSNFTGVRAGLQIHWFLIHLLAVIAFAATFNYLIALIFFSLDMYLKNPSIKDVVDILKTCLVVVISIIYASLIRYGFSVESLGSIAVFGPLAGFLTILGAYLIAGNAIEITSIVIPITLISVAGLGMMILASGAISAAMGSSYAFKVYAIGAIFGTVVCYFLSGKSRISSIIIFGILSNLILSTYAVSRVLMKDKKYELTRSLVVGIGVFGGTSFCGSSLRQVTFVDALLRNTDFSRSKTKLTNLQHINWLNCIGLEKAYFKDNLMTNAAVRNLLVTGDGYKKSYAGFSFEGANLNEFNLEGANLKYSDLTNAVLKKTNLKNANLSGVTAINADFSESYMTGACLEAFNIDPSTKFHGVDCQFIYLLENPNKLGDRERRPHDFTSTFAPGDFQKLYEEIVNTVEVLFRDGINREAFTEAFAKVCNEDIGVTPDSIQSIEKKGDSILVTLQVPDVTNKSQVESRFIEEYQAKILQLETQVNNLRELRGSDMKEIAISLTRREVTINNQAVGSGEIMSNDNSQSFQVGGNFNLTATNSVVSLREISGNIENSIEQLSSVADNECSELVNSLNSLKTVIEGSQDISEDDKIEALQQVDAIAKIAVKPEEAESKKMANTAMKILKGTASMLSPTASLVESLSKCLPVVSSFFGL